MRVERYEKFRWFNFLMYYCRKKNATNIHQLHSVAFSNANGPWFSLCTLDMVGLMQNRFGICVLLLINGGKCFALCCHSSFESISRALIFPLWSCSSLANQTQRLKDEFLVKIIIKDKIFRECLSAVAVAVKWPFLHRRRSVWMRQELKGNLVCKLQLLQREGLVETFLTELLWESLTGCPGKARICPDVVPWNTEVLCFGCRCWGRFSCFRVSDLWCRLSLSLNGKSSHMSKKGAWDGISRLYKSRNLMGNTSHWTLLVLSLYTLTTVLPFSKNRSWISTILIHICAYYSKKASSAEGILNTSN